MTNTIYSFFQRIYTPVQQYYSRLPKTAQTASKVAGVAIAAFALCTAFYYIYRSLSNRAQQPDDKNETKTNPDLGQSPVQEITFETSSDSEDETSSEGESTQSASPLVSGSEDEVRTDPKLDSEGTVDDEFFTADESTSSDTGVNKSRNNRDNSWAEEDLSTGEKPVLTPSSSPEARLTPLSPKEQWMEKLKSGFKSHPEFADYLLQTVFRKNEIQTCDFDPGTGKFTLNFAEHKVVKFSDLPEFVWQEIPGPLHGVVRKILGTDIQINQNIEGQITHLDGHIHIAFDQDAFKAINTWVLTAYLKTISMTPNNELSLDTYHTYTYLQLPSKGDIPISRLLNILRCNFNPSPKNS